jgi:hypothetical protein
LLANPPAGKRTLTAKPDHKLAFDRNSAQDASTIFVLACLSATCPFSGHSFQVIHNTQIVRFHARFVRGILLWRPRDGYWNRKVL